MADWVVISSLATAGGTLALAGTTFLSVKSANRASRFAERSLLASLRPLLLPSQPQDPAQKVNFMDAKWFQVPGGGVVADVSDTAIYLVISLRNVAAGIAVLHGWRPGRRHRLLAGDVPRSGESGVRGCARGDRVAHEPDGRAPLRRPRRGPAHDQPVRAHPARGRRLDRRGRSALARGRARPSLAVSGRSGMYGSCGSL